MAFQQNLAGAQGGTIQGAHGGTQQLGAAALRRLGGGAPAGPNMAGGDLNPGATPPIMDPAQKPAPPQPGGMDPGMAARLGAQQMKPMALPGFQPMPGISGPPGGGMGPGGLQTFGDSPGMFVPPGGPADGGTVDLPGGGKPIQWGTPGQGLQGPGGGPDEQMGQRGGPQGGPVIGTPLMPGPGGPPPTIGGALPGFMAAPGVHSMPGAPGIGGQMPGGPGQAGKPFGGDQRPMGAMPGPNVKFPPQKPGGGIARYPPNTKPLPTDQPATGVGGGIRPGGAGFGGTATGGLRRNAMATY